MRRASAAFAAALAAALFALPGAARGQAAIGPQLSLAEDHDFGLGGRVVANIADYGGWEGVGSFDVFFPEGDVDYWEINGNIVYNFPVDPARAFFPYLGGGLNVAHLDGPGGADGDVEDTEVGLNVVGGGKFDATGVTPFVEARIEIEGGEQFVLTGGLLFP